MCMRVGERKRDQDGGRGGGGGGRGGRCNEMGEGEGTREKETKERGRDIQNEEGLIREGERRS